MAKERVRTGSRATATPSSRWGTVLGRPAPAPPPASGGPMTFEHFVALPKHLRPLLVVADGMGLDSSGMLEVFRRFGIRPDVILHAETGDESKKTVAFRDER